MHMPMEFSDSDDNAAPVEDDEHDRGRVKKVAARSEEEAELDPAQVREDLLDFLDDLSSAEETTGSDSDDDQHRKYHHLPWRGRCWRVSRFLLGSHVTITCSLLLGRLHLYSTEGQS